MDRNFTSRDFESIKKTILMHQEIFKQQVQELHRLYNVQNKLMKEPGNPGKHRNEMGNYIIEVLGVRGDSREFGDSSRNPIKFGLEKQVEPTSSITYDRSKEPKDDSRNIGDEESNVEVELKLGLGHCPKKQYKRPYPHKCNSELTGNLDRTLGKVDKDQDRVQPSLVVIDSSSGNVCQVNTRPHWLFQDLGSNRT